MEGMSRRGRPTIHDHLSREAIARAALAVVDARGAEALTVRSLAAELGVGAATLYRHVAGRDEVVRDLVGLLLDEVDTSEHAGERWDDTIRRIGRSLRAMALRHPRAFTLVAAASVDEWPVREYAAAVMALHAPHGIPDEVFARLWSTVDAFLTGFLLLATAALVQAGEPTPPGSAPLTRPSTVSAESFEYGLDVMLTGLRTTDPVLAR